MKLFNPLIDWGYIPNSRYGRGGVRGLSTSHPHITALKKNKLEKILEEKIRMSYYLAPEQDGGTLKKIRREKV